MKTRPVNKQRGFARVGALLSLLVLSAAVSARAEKIKFDRLSLDEGLSQASGNAILEDRQGFLWIGTQDGLNLWNGYEFEVFKRDVNDESSLADNFVARLWEDRDGQIWVLHPGGRALTLVDPLRRTFRRLGHRPDDPASLAPATQFSSLPLEDEKGRLWLATIDAGIDLIDRATLRVERLRHDPEDAASLAGDRVNALLRAADGAIWVATQVGLQKRLAPVGAGTERFATLRHDPEDATSLPGDEVIGLLEDPGGDIWVGTTQGLARCRADLSSCERLLVGDAYPMSIEELDGQDPYAVPGLFDGRGRLWVGTRPGLARYDPADGSFRHHRADRNEPHSLSSANFQDVFEDSSGELWFATANGGVNRYLESTDSFQVFRHDPADPRSLSNDIVNDIYESRGGTLWFGTFGGGVSVFNRSKHKFHHYAEDPRDPAGLTDSTVFSILVDRQETLWVGTQGGGLHRYSEDRSRVVERYSLDPGGSRDLGSDYAQALFEDSTGRFWVGTGGGGLVLIDRDAGRVANRYTNDPGDAASLSADGVNALYEDSDGQLWVATGRGLDLFDPRSGTFEHLVSDPENPDTSLPRARLRKLSEDRQGRFWLATSAGLCQLDRPTHTFTCLRHDPSDPNSLSHDSVMDFWQAPDDTLWIATYGGGLNHFDPETGAFELLTTHEGLPNDSLYSVLPDGRGFLWLSSNHGLVRFDPQSRQMTSYDLDDGLQSNEFNDRAFFASADGELFFGGIRGYNSFRPEEIQASAFQPPVVLTAFHRLGPRPETLRTFADRDEIVVSYRDFAFSFEFAALDYATPARNLYRYRLEGFDESWIDSGHRRFASYTNLDGGNYIFRVRGSSADGVWNEEGASIRVRVIPPPWKTWWAYAAYVALSMGAVFGYVRVKTVAQEREVEQHRQEAARLKQIDRMKDEFLANTSHELRTPLNGIIGITESVLDGATGEVGPATRDNLQMVATSGRRLAHLVDDILDFAKLKNHEIVLREGAIALRELVEVTLTLTRPLVGDRQLELINEVPVDFPRLAADEGRLQQILHNLIGNAVKFTRSGSVRVSVERRGDRAAIAVSDTGVGIPADKLERIFESFEQADASSAREFGGTGLGLSISRQLVELHGGQVEARSTVGEGSVFTFTLPLWDEARLGEGVSLPDGRTLAPLRDRALSIEPLRLPSHEERPPREQARRGGHILCVDDEPVNLQVLENILSFEGYAVRRANDGLEALDILRRGFVPDLILLDVMMPRMTGFEVAQRIRQDFPAHRLPILLVTAKNQVSDLVEGLSSGANDYLSKPFSKEELLARVHTHLELSRAQQMEAENQRKTEEMRQARAIQLSLLPKGPPEHPLFDIAAHLETASEVGGDYYDFFPQADGSIYVVTGDATGHGISAGMMVSMTKSALKALDVRAPDVLLQQLNSVMRAVDLTRMQMALNVVHLQATRAVFSSAAMPPVLLRRASSGDVEEHLLSGLPLGAMAEPVYDQRTVPFEPGDSLVLLSDGLPELVDRRPGGDGYGVVREAIRRWPGGPAQGLLDRLLELLGGQELDDDVTIVVVRRR